MFYLIVYYTIYEINVFLTQIITNMSKFGELVDSNIPILLSFYTNWNNPSVQMHAVLRDVAAAMGDNGKVVKIDIEKDQIKLIPLEKKVTHVTEKENS